MIDISNWHYFYKLDVSGNPVTTNMLYTPIVNPEENIMCMLYDETHTYQTTNKRPYGVLKKDLVDFFFEREVKNLVKFQGKKWMPKLIDVDIDKRRVFIEYHPDTINRILITGRNLDTECPDWQEQMFDFLKEIDDLGTYKVSLYPHCFYIKDGILKTFDFYACMEKDSPYISKQLLSGIIGMDSTNRFDRATNENGDVDFKIFYKITLQEQLALRWPVNPFPEFYNRIANV